MDISLKSQHKLNNQSKKKEQEQSDIEALSFHVKGLANYNESLEKGMRPLQPEAL